MFYQSSNHAMRVNWEKQTERLDKFCANTKNRQELIGELRQIANELEFMEGK